MKGVLAALTLVLPWSLRRLVLQRACGYRIHPTSRIGFSLVAPKMLVMDEHAWIGHLNVCRGIDLLHLGPHSAVGSLNFITGQASDSALPHYHDNPARRPELLLGRHSSVTTLHYLECSDRVRIGEFAVVAGRGSTFFTHGVDVLTSRQMAEPISIGSHCYVGTNCVILGGGSLADNCVLGAMSLLNCPLRESHQLCGGIPARAIKPLPEDALFFSRAEGAVI